MWVKITVKEERSDLYIKVTNALIHIFKKFLEQLENNNGGVQITDNKDHLNITYNGSVSEMQEIEKAWKAAKSIVETGQQGEDKSLRLTNMMTIKDSYISKGLRCRSFTVAIVSKGRKK